MQNAVQFAVGQRWLSETEPELGLGIVVDVDFRTVVLEFRATDESRRYASAAAPLNRILFAEGDSVRDRQARELRVDSVSLDKGLATYQVLDADNASLSLPESELSDRLLLNRPADRLMSGQIDSYQWFSLKKQTLQQLGQIEQSSVLGLCSARTELIPHQLYIASEVARRYAPRVMLADEVGLGKTIEAGLILQQQLSSGLASRVLIIVPEALLHQWLVEMLRRFNLRFSLLDEERCKAIAEEHQGNPFLDEQLVLTSMDLLSSNPALFAQACAGEWDLCIVDEAHHLQDTAAELQDSGERADADQQSDYQRMQALAQHSNGMLLLTATPEQLGDESHFALLRLLDPNRFSSLEAFRAEQAHYRSLAGTINAMLEDPSRQQEIQRLLDEHGTGRILFRNTRRSLSGFPERKLNAWPLQAMPLEAAERETTDSEADEDTTPDALGSDPRVQWLIDFLQRNRKDKVLLICARDQTAIALERHLRVKAGIRSSVFHRFMNIVERDRAAAYFAGSQDGARILVCSEIGSEGRNFQFCRHLVLFDLPLNPDLLEQRIGRLDRIGQKHTIQIHVPYSENSEQALLFRWYQEALNAFEQVAPSAWRVFREHEATLRQFLAASPQQQQDSEPAFQAFLKQVAARTRQLNLELEKGRDRLLELNSFRADEAAAVIEAIHRFEAQASPQSLLCSIFDSYGIHYEENSDDTWTIHPGEEMLLPSFPELPDDGIEGSFHRSTALHREDVQFLHWQHPLVSAAMDLVLDSHPGRAAVSSFDANADTALAGHKLIVETLYRVLVPAPRHLQLARYFPATSLHFSLSAPAVLPQHDGQDDDEDAAPRLPQLLAIDTEALRPHLQYTDRHEAARRVRVHQEQISALLAHSEQLARAAMTKSVNMAAKSMLETQTAEIRRLVALKQRNPNVRESELDYLKSQTLQLHESFKQASVELVAVHVMLASQ